MSDTAVERLVRLVSDAKKEDDAGDDGGQSRKALDIRLAEGWFSLLLVAGVVYSTIWSIQAVYWVDHLSLLTPIAALGIAVGVVTAKQRYLSGLLIHLVTPCIGFLWAFWLTAGAYNKGDLLAFVRGMQGWFTTAIHGGRADGASLLLLFILTFGFILAYMSAWLVYRTRSPWLAIMVNAAVLLINLSNVGTGDVVILTFFLVASLLLLLRINVYESVMRWRQQGLKYMGDIGWAIMQVGAWVSLGILVLSWILPAGYMDPAASQIWTLNIGPWGQLQNTWNRVIGLQAGSNPSNHGNFRDTLMLGGNPNLNGETVFTVQSSDGSQYLASLSYDTYTVESGWSVSSLDSQPINANQEYSSGAMLTHALQQRITVVNPPGEEYPYLFGATQISSISLPANVLTSQSTGEVIALLGQRSFLTAHTTYTVVSQVSSADQHTLSLVPLPSDAPKTLPTKPDMPVSPNYYNPAIVHTYTQLPPNLDPAIADLAKRITAIAPTMYDKVAAIEYYLRAHYMYSLDIQRPLDQEGVSWFLFHSGNKGFCNYFASAMAVMARSLGIPARVMVGYSNGEEDLAHHQRVIHGTNAHAWTQIYFAGYGWINFEPSATFATFTRPQPNQYGSTSATPSTPSSKNDTIAPTTRKKPFQPQTFNHGDIGDGINSGKAWSFAQQIRTGIVVLIVLLLASGILFSMWWSRLFIRYDLATRIYGRFCLLARWAGIEIRPSQTPYEHMQAVAIVAPKEANTLERLGSIYVRHRWADPESIEHPRRSGEWQELPALWGRLQVGLWLYVVRHPYFLSWLQRRMGHWLWSMCRKRPLKSVSDGEELV